jgi:6,7-dimethyl-8-ribityllumazine synthase
MTMHILIVTANFYPDISAELLAGATTELAAKGATYEVVEVPGAFEIPSAVRLAIAGNVPYDGYVALGCVIRGDTTHYDYVCTESARGLMELSLQYGAAIGYGILTVENPEQAWVRARVSEGNKGRDAVQACLTMASLKTRFGISE